MRRRSELKRGKPLKAKRKYKAVADRHYHDWIASLGCLVCGADAEVHHVTGFADRPGRIARDHWLVAPLCPAHHRCGISNGSVEALGHQGFFEAYGYDLYLEAMQLAETYQRVAA